MPNRTTAFLKQDQFDRIRSTHLKFNEPWAEEDIDISQELGRTPNSIRIKLRSLGGVQPSASPKPWTPEEESELVEMFKDVIKFNEIANQLNRSEKTVVSRLVKMRMELFQ